MLSALRRLFARCLPTTLAGKASAVTAVVLVITVGVSWAYFVTQGSLPFEFALAGRLWLILIPLIALPIVLYYLISYWGRPVKSSLFPDIDDAWQPGMDAMKKIGWSLQSAPIFLVLGPSGEQMEQSIVQAMKSAGVKFKVDEVPSGAGVGHALRWYATQDAIYLFCSEVGALTQLAHQWAAVGDRAPSVPGMPHSSPGAWKPSVANDMTRPTTPAPLPSDQPAPADLVTRTLDPFGSPPSTVDPPAPPTTTLSPLGAPRPGQPPRPHTGPATRLPSDVDLPKEMKRLQYLCRLLRRERKTHCGINGILTLLPFELTMVEERGRELQALVESIRADVGTIQEALSLRFPITALVVGMDRASGFGKFVGAMEPGNLAQRLGSGFNVRRRPTGERLRRLSDGICDAFEDWIYVLYRKQDEIGHEDLDQDLGNMKLYGLLCRMRQNLKPKLYATLGQAFSETNGDGAAQQDAESSLLFSGCYLGATGNSSEKQAFIKGIHDKLVREQSNVQWTSRALLNSSLIRLMTWIGWIFFSVSVVFLLVVLVAASR